MNNVGMNEKNLKDLCLAIKSNQVFLHNCRKDMGPVFPIFQVNSTY